MSSGPPRAGGTLRLAVSSDQGCVDPQQVGSNDTIYSVRQLVDSLTDQDPQTGQITPWLATEWQANADASAYTFTLRTGVTFSDGTPLTEVRAGAAGLARGEHGDRGPDPPVPGGVAEVLSALAATSAGTLTWRRSRTRRLCQYSLPMQRAEFRQATRAPKRGSAAVWR